MSVSPKQYRYALAQLGLDQLAAAKLLNVGARTSRRYAESGITSGPVELLLRLLLMKLTAQLAAKLGWDNEGYEAAKTEAARIFPRTHRAEADARHLAALWRIISQGPATHP